MRHLDVHVFVDTGANVLSHMLYCPLLEYLSTRGLGSCTSWKMSNPEDI